MRSAILYLVALVGINIAVQDKSPSVCVCYRFDLIYILSIDMASTSGPSSESQAPGTSSTPTSTTTHSSSDRLGVSGFKTMLDQSVQEAVSGSLTGFLATIDARIQAALTPTAHIPTLAPGSTQSGTPTTSVTPSSHPPGAPYFTTILAHYSLPGEQRSLPPNQNGIQREE